MSKCHSAAVGAVGFHVEDSHFLLKKALVKLKSGLRKNDEGSRNDEVLHCHFFPIWKKKQNGNPLEERPSKDLSTFPLP